MKKFDIDQIHYSWQQIVEQQLHEEPDRDHAVIDFEAKRKLTKLLRVMHSTERGQRTGPDVRAKQANYYMVKELLEKIQKCEPLTRDEMTYCNDTWKRYS